MIRLPSLPLLLAALLALLPLACSKESTASAAPPAPAPAASAPPAAAPTAPTAPTAVARGSAGLEPAAALQVTRIVFVGKEKACECTQKRIDGSWAALQAALAKKSAVPVERLNLDTQSDQVAFYQGLRAILAIPAIYFLDSKGELVEMLQGEVTEPQASGALR